MADVPPGMRRRATKGGRLEKKGKRGKGRGRWGASKPDGAVPSPNGTTHDVGVSPPAADGPAREPAVEDLRQTSKQPDVTDVSSPEELMAHPASGSPAREGGANQRPERCDPCQGENTAVPEASAKRYSEDELYEILRRHAAQPSQELLAGLKRIEIFESAAKAFSCRLDECAREYIRRHRWVNLDPALKQRHDEERDMAWERLLRTEMMTPLGVRSLLNLWGERSYVKRLGVCEKEAAFRAIEKHRTRFDRSEEDAYRRCLAYLLPSVDPGNLREKIRKAAFDEVIAQLKEPMSWAADDPDDAAMLSEGRRGRSSAWWLLQEVLVDISRIFDNTKRTEDVRRQRKKDTWMERLTVLAEYVRKMLAELFKHEEEYRLCGLCDVLTTFAKISFDLDDDHQATSNNTDDDHQDFRFTQAVRGLADACQRPLIDSIKRVGSGIVVLHWPLKAFSVYSKIEPVERWGNFYKAFAEAVLPKVPTVPPGKALVGLGESARRFERCARKNDGEGGVFSLHDGFHKAVMRHVKAMLPTVPNNKNTYLTRVRLQAIIKDRAHKAWAKRTPALVHAAQVQLAAALAASEGDARKSLCMEEIEATRALMALDVVLRTEARERAQLDDSEARAAQVFEKRAAALKTKLVRGLYHEEMVARNAIKLEQNGSFCELRRHMQCRACGKTFPSLSHYIQHCQSCRRVGEKVCVHRA